MNALAEALRERGHSEPRREVYAKVLPVVHVRVPSATRPSHSYSHSVGRLIGSMLFNRKRSSTATSAGSFGLFSKGHHHQETQQGQQDQVEPERQRQISLTDPVLSKWLLLMLGLSVLLNGYLLRGIAAGFVGGVGVGVGVEEGTKATVDGERGVRFLEVPLDVEKEEVRKRVVVVEEEVEDTTSKAKEQERSSSASVATQTLTQTTPTHIPPKTSPSSTSTPSITTMIRPLSTLLPLFNAAARPLAPFLATLNDEELILLVQNGKVAVYDLERVLSSGIELLDDDDEDEEINNLKMKAEALERAVRVRRALICE